MISRTNARDELERLLSESVASARARAASTFDEIAGDAPVVLFGAGGLGKRIAESLIALGRPPIAFADNDPARAGTSLRGIPVLSAADAIARYGNDAVFVVTIWRNPATEQMSDRIDRLRALGAKRVTSFVTLSWKYPERMLPYYSMDLPQHVLEAKDDVFRGFELLGDERSEQEFVAHLRLRLHLDFAGLLAPAREPQYFAPDLYRLREDEHFVDCGAFDGDTIRALLRLVPGFSGRIAAFEPDAENFARLDQWRSAQPPAFRDRIEVTRAGVGARRERVAFCEGSGTGSAVGEGTTEIDIVPLDETVEEMRPTLVKVDTEGYEPEVLEGAHRVITTQTPTLALSAYHRQDHPWRLPLMVAGMNAGYRFSLRSYYHDGWELVLYAVPEKRR